MGARDTGRQGAQGLYGAVAGTAGMALFWPYLRYASFVEIAYPSRLDAPLGPWGLSAHVALLVALALLTAAALVNWRRIEELLACRRSAVAATMALPAVGAALAFAAADGLLPPGVLWPSVACTALGFLACFLAWADWWSRTWNPTSVALLGTSFLAGYLLFSHHGLANSLIGDRGAALAMALGCAALWWLCGPVEAGRRQGEPFSARACLTPLVVLVGTLLAVGGAVRGIIDLQQSSSTLRFGLSIALAALLVGAGVAHWLGGRPSREAETGRTLPRPAAAVFASVPRLMLVCWIGIAVLFLLGLFLFLVMDNKLPGGDVAIVCRSCMEFVLWIALCDLSHARRMAAVPVFLAFGTSVEVASWLLSYALVPALVGPTAHDGVLAPNVIVLAVLFGIIGLGLTGYGAYAAVMPGGGPRLAEPGWAPRGGKDDKGLLDSLVATEGLTPKEASVAILYAQGYSLGKVAEQLGITKGAAQSHIKAAYRKLDVHSKDDLIEHLGRV